MNDAQANEILHRITALADEAFSEHARADGAVRRTKQAADRFVALRDAQAAAQYAMRVELHDRAIGDLVATIPLDCAWRHVAAFAQDRVRETARRASICAIEALEAVRSKPLGQRGAAAGGAL